MNGKGKIIIQGTLKLLSSTLIGGSENHNSDADVLRNAQGTPYIPATSFVGVLRSLFCLRMTKIYPDSEADIKTFWGYTEKEKSSKKGDESYVSQQSLLTCSDLKPVSDEYSVVRRDGIKIDSSTGIVEDEKKYDYEVIEPGAKFKVQIQINDNSFFAQQMAVSIINALEKGEIRLGAKTRNGLGKVTIEDAKAVHFDFSQAQDVGAWLRQDFSQQKEVEVEPFKIERPKFQIKADFLVNGSMIIRTYPSNPDSPDSVHIRSADKPVLPGVALKGAIRSRMQRIIRTVKGDEHQHLDRKIFGYVDDAKQDENGTSGKLFVEETEIKGGVEEIQTRIKIDRFTGGTIESALFDTMPVFANKDTKVTEVTISLYDYEEWEAGLLLLVLKDLWTGDLAIGGEKSIGRGTLHGIQAEVTSPDGQALLVDKDGKLDVQPEEGKSMLENFVKAFVSYQGENNASSNAS